MIVLLNDEYCFQFQLVWLYEDNEYLELEFTRNLDYFLTTNHHWILLI